ncbi:MAG: SAM-dependent methyltransferase, partial [Nitrososphaerales archaeon]
MGAGPGDPGLLTIGALLRLREADMVIYDRLVSEEVLSLIPQEIPRVYGGKDSGSKGGDRQHELNDLMLREARSGKKVVRLKGGDPF